MADILDRLDELHRGATDGYSAQRKEAFLAEVIREYPTLAARLRAAEADNAALRARVEALDQANTGLAVEAERLRSGLRFYAHREHVCGFEGFSEGDDPESPDWLCDPHPSGDMIESGGVARAVLSGAVPNWDGEEPMEHPCEPVMRKIAALTPPAVAENLEQRCKCEPDQPECEYCLQAARLRAADRVVNHIRIEADFHREHCKCELHRLLAAYDDIINGEKETP